MKTPTHEVFERPNARERGWLLNYLRDETVGGVLLLIAATVALVWANSPWSDTYFDLVNTRVGPESIGPVHLGLNLPLGVWAADGLLALFFFVVGLELKHELVVGTLSKPAQAVVPVAAAIGGMVIPALIYVVINSRSPDGDLTGWGVPMATDIAFALAVLAVFGRRLPVALRAFLLTLAVVDDLGAITVIAIFYSEKFNAGWFIAALVTFVIYGIAQRQRIRTPFLYVPIALLAWYFTHESGVHATVAGVALGLLTRVRTDPGEKEAPADRLAHMLHPVSAGFAVPVFALFAAGVNLGAIGIDTALTTPVSIGIILGLVIGKPLGVLLFAWVTATFTRASLASGISWRDITAIGVLAGIGFTVALLIAELGYRSNPILLESSKAAVLAASLLAAAIASLALLSRGRHYARLEAERDLPVERASE